MEEARPFADQPVAGTLESGESTDSRREGQPARGPARGPARTRAADFGGSRSCRPAPLARPPPRGAPAATPAGLGPAGGGRRGHRGPGSARGMCVLRKGGSGPVCRLRAQCPDAHPPALPGGDRGPGADGHRRFGYPSRRRGRHLPRGTLTVDSCLQAPRAGAAPERAGEGTRRRIGRSVRGNGRNFPRSGPHQGECVP